MDYNNLAKKVIKLVGGKENVNNLEHCMTRLRFDLKNNDLVQIEELKKVEGVITVKNSVGQIQVVIGNEVADVYNEAIKQLGTINKSSGEEKTEKMSIGARIIDFITAAILPCMAVMCASGLIKGLNVLVAMFGLYSVDSSYYAIINGVGDAAFYFFPIMAGYNAAKKLGMTPFLGLTIGAILVYPPLNGVELDVFGQTITTSYASTFFPIIVLVLLAAPLEKYLNKIMPNAIKTFIVPALVLLLIVPVGFLFIGPVANQIGTVISTVFIKMYDISPILTGFLLGGTILILIVFGLHTIIGLSNYLNVIQGIPDPIMPLKAFSTIAVTAATFAVYLRTKKKSTKDIALASTISGLLGVTEPGLYGILVPNMRVFIAASLGSAAGGVIAAIYGMHAYAFTGSGFFVFLGFLDPDDPQVFPIILGLIIASVLSFTLALFTYREEQFVESESDLNSTNITIPIPISGKVADITTAKDDAFSSAVMGDGIVIVPSEGLVFAPFDGEVEVLFPSKHAIGLKSKEGVEILIHVGEDTVNLNGEYFTAHVKQGDLVKQGDVLVEFDLEKLIEKGYNTETPVILTNKEQFIINEKPAGSLEALTGKMEVNYV